MALLAGFSLSLIEKDRIIGKYVGMRYPLAREHDVYFINWMTIVRYCIAHGIEWMQTGQTTYKQKIRLGCQLKRSWVYFRHRGSVAGPIVGAVGRRMRFDQMDPDLRGPDDDLPYLEAEPRSAPSSIGVSFHRSSQFDPFRVPPGTAPAAMNGQYRITQTRRGLPPC